MGSVGAEGSGALRSTFSGAAGATGTVGPDLDKLSGEAQKAGKPVEAFIRESIVNPGAYVQPGFPNNVMPKTMCTL